MGTRRQARECALQMLYQLDLSGNSFPAVQAHFWEAQPMDAQTVKFANDLTEGVLAQKDEIDLLIAKYSEHWKINRMAAVDKNLLRLAIYEIKNFPDIPVKVTLNEAIEIAKKFGSEESGSFINGVLDKIAKEFGKE